MKLLKKLLPIASVAGVAAIVTPLVTSCGMGTVKLDGKGIYIPKAARAVPEKSKIETGYTSDEATELYYKDIKDNPNIFAEDLTCALSTTLFYMLHDTSAAAALFSDVDVRVKYSNIKSSFDSENKVIYMSFNIKAKSQIKLKSSLSNSNERSAVIGRMLTDLDRLDVKVENVAYRLRNIGQSEISNGWIVAPAEIIPGNSGYSADKKQSIEARIDGYFYAGTTAGVMMFNDETIKLSFPYTEVPSLRDQFAFEYIVRYFAAATAPAYSYHMGDINKAQP